MSRVWLQEFCRTGLKVDYSVKKCFLRKGYMSRIRGQHVFQIWLKLEHSAGKNDLPEWLICEDYRKKRALPHGFKIRKFWKTIMIWSTWLHEGSSLPDV